jgi:hypothetical protein
MSSRTRQPVAAAEVAVAPGVTTGVPPAVAVGPAMDEDGATSVADAEGVT